MAESARKRARLVPGVTETTNDTSIHDLPREILVAVFAQMHNVKDLAACSATCPYWRSIVWPSVNHLPQHLVPLDIDEAHRFATMCPSLQSLDIELWPKHDGDSIDVLRSIVVRLPRLQQLTLREFHGDYWSALAGSTALRDLRVTVVRGTEVFFGPLPSLTSLYVLSGTSAIHFDNEWSSLQALYIACTRLRLGLLPVGLRVLKISGLSTDTSTALSCLPNLTELELRHICLDSPLSHLTGLRSLVYSEPADQQFASALSDFNGLTRLELAALPDVSLTLPTSIVRLEVDVEKVDNLHQLSRLTHVWPIAGWNKLWDIPHLESLCLWKSPYGGAPVPDYLLSSLQVSCCCVS
eukprot:TRINITY_DN1455_c0_g2_i4.p1 TRINITY_DN1455_c0_g2~~TRINITY_DN1455_c0_g2_i4.p1  ORF type:complete len:353 (+),score=9.90 TRINITY_DN1455_c0_g2_i4:116-1174(+)